MTCLLYRDPIFWGAASFVVGAVYSLPYTGVNNNIPPPQTDRLSMLWSPKGFCYQLPATLLSDVSL